MDLVFILDASTSVYHDNYKKVLKFVKNVLKDADIDSGEIFGSKCDHVSLIVYYFLL